MDETKQKVETAVVELFDELLGQAREVAATFTDLTSEVRERQARLNARLRMRTEMGQIFVRVASCQ
jgi:hypothetical protein